MWWSDWCFSSALHYHLFEGLVHVSFFFLPLYTIIYDKTGTQYVQKYLNG